MEAETRGLDVVLGHDCRKLLPGVIIDGRPIVIQLHADGSVWVNQDAVAEKDIVPLINRILSTRQEKLLYLMAQESVPYRRLVAIADQLRQGTYVDYIAMNRDLGPGRFEEQSCFTPNLYFAPTR